MVGWHPQEAAASGSIHPTGPVPVIPLALQGLWGSFFSRDPDKGLFHRLWSRVTLVAGPAVTVEVAEPAHLQALVGQLRGTVR